MAGIGDTFREIHRLRRHARDLQQELDRGPYRLKAHKAKAAKVEDQFREAQEALKKLKDAIGDQAYYSGCLPPHVPVWRFGRID